MTETRPADGPPDTRVDPVAAPPAEPSGLHGWLSTADHKRIGRLYLITSLVLLVVGGVAGAVLGAERIDSGLAILDEGTFGQVHTLHGEVAVFGFLVPFFLGLATYLVPLQVGAPNLAFARGAAFGYWGYVVSAGVLLAAYAADGGPGGGSDVAVDLHLLALIGLNLAFTVGLITVLTTALGWRAPGMTLLRTPLFTWSIVVGGGLTLLATPVLVGRLIEGYIGHHFGGVDATVAGTAWFWSVPQVYVLAVPAAGVAAEIVPVLSRSRHRAHAAVVVVLGLLGVLGYGAWAQLPERTDELLYVGMALAALLPALALLAILGDAMRRGRPSLGAANLLAIGAAVQLLLGALAGAAAAIDPLELQGTTWQAAQVHYTLYGAATMGAFAALWFWAPKIWGVLLGEAQGKAVFALTFLGAILLSAPDLVSGLLEDQLRGATTFDDDGLTVAMNVLSLVGGVLAILGVLVVAAELVTKVGRRSGTPAADDPWGGSTLEWSTTSPPPAGNFTGPVPVVTSATPLLDARTGTEVDA